MQWKSTYRTYYLVDTKDEKTIKRAIRGRGAGGSYLNNKSPLRGGCEDVGNATKRGRGLLSHVALINNKSPLKEEAGLKSSEEQLLGASSGWGIF